MNPKIPNILTPDNLTTIRGKQITTCCLYREPNLVHTDFLALIAISKDCSSDWQTFKRCWSADTVGTEHRGPLCDSWASCSRNFATFVTFTHFSANRKLDYILIEQDRFILHEHDHIFIIPIYRGRLEVTGQLTWDRPCSSPGGVNISHWSGKRYRRSCISRSRCVKSRIHSSLQSWQQVCGATTGANEVLQAMQRDRLHREFPAPP